MIWLIAEHYSDYSTIREQLVFLEQEIAEKGISLYLKMDSVGIWWYRSMTADDWDAWIAWVN